DRPEAVVLRTDRQELDPRRRHQARPPEPDARRRLRSPQEPHLGARHGHRPEPQPRIPAGPGAAARAAAEPRVPAGLRAAARAAAEPRVPAGLRAAARAEPRPGAPSDPG